MDGNGLHVLKETGEYLNAIKRRGVIYRIVLGWERFKLNPYRIIKQLTGHALFKVTSVTANLYYWIWKYI